MASMGGAKGSTVVGVLVWLVVLLVLLGTDPIDSDLSILYYFLISIASGIVVGSMIEFVKITINIIKKKRANNG